MTRLRSRTRGAAALPQGDVDHLHGDALWARFTAPPGETAWYYGAVRDTLVDPGDLPSPLVRLLSATVAELVARAG